VQQNPPLKSIRASVNSRSEVQSFLTRELNGSRWRYRWREGRNVRGGRVSKWRGRRLIVA